MLPTWLGNNGLDKDMSLEDAAMRVEATSDSFVVFRNADTDAVSILYRRKDGNLGLIEPD